jgi:hypothetical protein
VTGARSFSKRRRATIAMKRIDFAKVNATASGALPGLLARWLPGGAQRGEEYVVRNPRRDDRRAGSFRINVRTGKWADFATGDRGGDPVSLFAFLKGLNQAHAAVAVAQIVGIDPYARDDRACRQR